MEGSNSHQGLDFSETNFASVGIDHNAASQYKCINKAEKRAGAIEALAQNSNMFPQETNPFYDKSHFRLPLISTTAEALS